MIKERRNNKINTNKMRKWNAHLHLLEQNYFCEIGKVAYKLVRINDTKL